MIRSRSTTEQNVNSRRSSAGSASATRVAASEGAEPSIATMTRSNDRDLCVISFVEARTVRTGRSLSRSTPSAALPKKKRPTPLRACVPITITRASCARARSRITVTGSPSCTRATESTPCRCAASVAAARRTRARSLRASRSGATSTLGSPTPGGAMIRTTSRAWQNNTRPPCSLARLMARASACCDGSDPSTPTSKRANKESNAIEASRAL